MNKIKFYWMCATLALAIVVSWIIGEDDEAQPEQDSKL